MAKMKIYSKLPPTEVKIMEDIVENGTILVQTGTRILRYSLTDGTGKWYKTPYIKYDENTQKKLESIYQSQEGGKY